MDFYELLVIFVADERVDLGYVTDDVCPEGDVGLPELRLVVTVGEKLVVPVLGEVVVLRARLDSTWVS